KVATSALASNIPDHELPGDQPPEAKGAVKRRVATPTLRLKAAHQTEVRKCCCNRRAITAPGSAKAAYCMGTRKGSASASVREIAATKMNQCLRRICMESR